MKNSIRRVLALALCVFVLTAGTPFFVTSALTAGAAEQDAAAQPEKASPTDAEEPACRKTGEHVFEAYAPAEGGTHTSVCALCGETFTQDCVYADPAGWTDQGDGTHGMPCVLCGSLKTEPCSYEDAVTLPTATEAGFTTHTCTVCGAVLTDTETVPENERKESALLGDMNGNGSVGADDARVLLRLSVSLERLPEEKLPYGDMDHNGTITSADARLALRCSVKLEPTPDRHEFAVTVVKPAACVEKGALTYTCSYCGRTGELTVPSLGHSYETLSKKEPTCTADGKRVDRCSVCREERTVILRAKGHSFERKALKEAACTAAGEETVVCSVCKAEQKNVIPALGHDWVEATPAKAKRCGRCGEIVSGWTEIDGKSYYFKEDGSPMKGTQFIGGLIFNFGNDGASKTGRTGHKAKVAVLGDSIVESIGSSNVATDFDMYGKVSLHVDTIDSKYRSGSGRTVLREAVGRDYDVVILMLGVNDLTYDNTWWGNRYRQVLRQLKELVPEAIIYASAIMPINDSKTGASEKMWMVNAKNSVIRNAAAAEGVRYLGTPPGLLNANGQLPYDAATDGVHFGAYYCRVWYDWVKEQLK